MIRIALIILVLVLIVFSLPSIVSADESSTISPANAQKWLDTVKRHQQSAEYEKAVDILNKIIECEPEEDVKKEARICLGACYDALGEWKKAWPIHRHLAEDYEDIEAEQLYYLSRCFRHLNLLGAERELLADVMLHKNPIQDMAILNEMRTRFAEVSEAHKDWEGARWAYEILSAEAPENSKHWKQKIAFCSRMFKDWDRAIKDYQALIDEYPDLAKESREWLGWCYLGKEDYRNSLKVYQSLLQDYPDNSKEYNYHIACCYQGIGECRKAAQIFRDLFAEDKEWLEQKILKGENCTDDAKMILRVIASAEEDWATHSLFLVAKWHQEKGNYKLAANIYQDWVNKYSSYSSEMAKEAKVRRGVCLREACEWEEAANAHISIANEYPEDATEHLQYASWCYGVLEKYGKELQMISKAISAAKSPQHDEIVKNLRFRVPDIHISMRNHGEAIKAYEALINDYPESSADTRYKLASLIYEKKDWQEAIRQYQRLIEESPNHESKCIFELARCYQEIGNHEKAIRILKNVVEKFPPSDYRGSYGRLHLAISLAELGRTVESMALLDRYAAEYPDHKMRAEMWKGEVMVRHAKDNARGAIMLEDWLSRYADSGGEAYKLARYARAFLSQAYVSLGRWNDAAKMYLEQAIDSEYEGEKAELRLNAGNIYYRSENFQSAAPCYELVVDSKVDNDAVKSEALFKLAMCKHKLGYTDSSTSIMQRVIDDYPESLWAKQARGQLYLWKKVQ